MHFSIRTIGLSVLLASNLHGQEQTPVRGAVVDRNGVVLAESLPDGSRTHPHGALLERVLSDLEPGLDGVLSKSAGTAASLRVQLTIDVGLQQKLEAELETAWKTWKPETVTGLLLDPRTGEILALAGRSASEGKEKKSGHPAIAFLYEPGQTFKLVAAAAALDAGTVDMRTPIDCGQGRFTHEGETLHDAQLFGTLTLHDVLVQPTNIGSAKLALLAGEERFEEYARRFGFGERTGLELPGEGRGTFPSRPDWSQQVFLRVATGHSVTVTPLQMALGMAAVANGGTLMRPLLVRSLLQADGQEAQPFVPEPIRKVMSPESAAKITAAMKDAAASEYLKPVAVPGVAVAGWPSTTSKRTTNLRYRPDRFVTSFAGFLPAEDPELVCVIVVDDARSEKGRVHGSLVAAPIFSRVVRAP